MESKSSSSREVSRRKGRGMIGFKELEPNRIDERAIHAIWEGSCPRWDSWLIDSRCILPIVFEFGLSDEEGTERGEVFVVLVAVLIHANEFSSFWISSDRMGIHDSFVSSLIGKQESVRSHWFPEFGGEDLTEKCPGPQTLNDENVTMPQLMIIIINMKPESIFEIVHAHF